MTFLICYGIIALITFIVGSRYAYLLHQKSWAATYRGFEGHDLMPVFFVSFWWPFFLIAFTTYHVIGWIARRVMAFAAKDNKLDTFLNRFVPEKND